MVFVVKKIYKQYLAIDFYTYCAKELNITITYCRLPNKFDAEFRRLMSHPLGNRLLIYYFPILLLSKILLLFKKLIIADIYMHEFSNQRMSTKLFYWGKKLFNKKIIIYDHGHAIRLCEADKKIINEPGKVLFLNFHEHNRNTFTNLGYSQQFITGYPKFYTEWINIVKNYPDRYFAGQKIVVIYSRHLHSYYMDEDKYKILLISSFTSVRKYLPKLHIVVKPHPRENIELINNLLNNANQENFSISFQHAAILAKNAIFTISFWGSVILDALSMNVPAVEYFIEPEKFREIEPQGSSYKNIGIHSVDNEIELEQFITSVISDKYKFPQIINEIINIKNTNFINEYDSFV